MKILVTVLTSFLLACSSSSGPDSISPDVREALNSITADRLMKHIRVLSADEFEGRAPGGKGEELTVNYITGQLKALGLEPGNPDGTFVQKVPLVGYKSTPQLDLRAGGKRIPMTPLEDYVAISRHFTGEVNVKDSDLVFVGYGVVAPEYGWDDYKDVDVKGKTLVMLVNDPAVPDPNDPSKLDEKMFKGRAMTYYGRWTYKYEIATRKGAAAAIIIHETGPAGYPWAVVRTGWGSENFDIETPDNNSNVVPVESWITLAKARQLFKDCGKDFAALKKAAVSKDFRPVPLKATASFQIKNTLRKVQSRNVIAKLEGRDPVLKHEYVIYTAHWDHLGMDPSLKGDQIFNGALDNASGVAATIEIARAFTKLRRRPKRTLLFMAVTAEEQGLLGSKYYAENPLYPLAKTLADINIDCINQWGPTKDIIVVGLGNTTLDEVVAAVAKQQGRVVKPDSEPE
ncbi:MAG: M20/M25/M40 family metallo-hydrolase, partial [Candidatus Latescibacteria bacterium]|nr:M20/M25/M40 family metallo-hydrolase [Candidatus Latescibacterota bacterium]